MGATLYPLGRHAKLLAGLHLPDTLLSTPGRPGSTLAVASAHTVSESSPVVPSRALSDAARQSRPILGHGQPWLGSAP